MTWELTSKAELKRLAHDLQAILDEWRGRTMPVEVVAELDAKCDLAEELRDRLDAQEGHW